MNTIALNEADYYETMTMVGDQTYQTIGHLIGQSVQYHDRLRKLDKPIRVLIDVTKMGKLNLGAIESATIGLHDLPYDRLAVFGLSSKNDKIVQWLVRKTANPNKVKLFESHDEALEWLLLDPKAGA